MVGERNEKCMSFHLNWNQLSDATKIQVYLDTVEPICNERAFFSDGTKEYRNPPEPDKNESVSIRFRTAKDNVDFVFLLLDGEKICMRKESSEEYFDYYERTVQLQTEPVHYIFLIQTGKRVYYYTKKGVADEACFEDAFCIIPGFQTPDWAKGAVFYQIYIDRFCNGDATNNTETAEYIYIGKPVQRVDQWSRYPDTMDVGQFYGGDLTGVLKKLDYLQELGIEVIYFNPLFVSPSNHKYDSQDYDYIDPHLTVVVKEEGEVLKEGDMDNRHATKYICRTTDKENLEASNAFFVSFVQEVHKRGMRVILDGVFNHCGSFHRWLDRERIYESQKGYEKGAYIAADSPYRAYFQFFEQEWPYNGKYQGWWGHDTLPKLNYEQSTKLEEEILRIAKKWVSPPFCVDGWRLDVAADLGHSAEYNHLFWKKFRKVVKEANPQAIIIAEHYGDPSDWLQGEEWDTVMNYDAFMEPVSWFFTGVEKHSDEFRADALNHTEQFFSSMRNHMAKFHTPSLQVSMNQLSNHDHSRFLTRTNHMVGRLATLGSEAAEQNINKAVFREAIVVQLTWPGAPTLYYGDEAGLCGFTDPDSRRTYPWGKEDQELLYFYREMIRIHKDYEVLRTGSLRFLAGTSGTLVYGRFNRKEQVVVAINNKDREIKLDIPVWEIGLGQTDTLIQLMQTRQDGYSQEAIAYPVKNGILTIALPASAAIVMKNKEKNTF